MGKAVNVVHHCCRLRAATATFIHLALFFYYTNWCCTNDSSIFSSFFFSSYSVHSVGRHASDSSRSPYRLHFYHLDFSFCFSFIIIITFDDSFYHLRTCVCLFSTAKCEAVPPLYTSAQSKVHLHHVSHLFDVNKRKRHNADGAGVWALRVRERISFWLSLFNV